MKLVTYNIQYSRGKDGRLDLARIAEAVRGADLVALQEVDRHMPRAEEIDQPARLAELQARDGVRMAAMQNSMFIRDSSDDHLR